MLLQAITTEDDFMLHATSKIAHMCAYNVVLWQTFTDICTYNVRVIKVMAKEYHQSRVRALAFLHSPIIFYDSGI